MAVARRGGSPFRRRVKSDIQAAGERDRDSQRPAPRLRRRRAVVSLSWSLALQNRSTSSLQVSTLNRSKEYCSVERFRTAWKTHGAEVSGQRYSCDGMGKSNHLFLNMTTDHFGSRI